MTVISTVISRHCVAHASDSLLTEPESDGSRRAVEWQRSKIVPVRHWRGAMAYWGLASYEAYGWSTLDWLIQQSRDAQSFESAEAYALGLAEGLNQAIRQMGFRRAVDSGIGIHFTAYEYVEGYWIPELFLISNIAGTTYDALRPEGVGMSRDTFGAIASVPAKDEHGAPEYRLKVHQYLQEVGGVLIYNNGDPVLFNAAADAIHKMIMVLAQRGSLARPKEIGTYLAMARRPIDLVAQVQREFGHPDARVVGGTPHELAVEPNGTYTSNTGDAVGF